MIALSAVCASAQDRAVTYPQKPVRIIAGSAPGGAVDFIGRLAAQKLTEALGQPFLVEQRAGASGSIAAEHVAKAAPDGHTLSSASMATLCVVPHLYAKIGYDPVKDFAPVTIVAAGPFMFVVHPSLPVRNLKELIALARVHPGKLAFGTAGQGSVSHLGVEMLKSMAKVDLAHIPYKGVALAMIALQGGETALMYDPVLTSLPHVKAGRVRMLALGAAKRTPLLPDLPTVAEAGLPGFEFATWYAMWGIKGTPDDIIKRMAAEVGKALQDPAIKAMWARNGTETPSVAGEAMAKLIASDIEKWGKVVKTANVKLEGN